MPQSLTKCGWKRLLKVYFKIEILVKNMANNKEDVTWILTKKTEKYHWKNYKNCSKSMVEKLEKNYSKNGTKKWKKGVEKFWKIRIYMTKIDLENVWKWPKSY